MRKHIPKNNFGQFMETDNIGIVAEQLSKEYFAQFSDIDLDDLIAIFLSKLLWAKTQMMMDEVHTNNLSPENIYKERLENDGH